ncbi:signal peptidase I [Halarchaeum sp. P4]|uniref:signal peptidase I n=1 Tax=Halarchaeum sp. P4 TaxID=3421639 RepID=UPI003EB851F6
MAHLSDIDRRTALNALGILILVGAVAPFVITAAPQVIGAEHSYTVLSSSMSPTIDAGDIIVVNSVDPQTLSEGDVITFQPPAGHQLAGVDRVTHRIVDVVHQDGSLYFETKGDANEETDSALVPASNVVGVVWFHIPLIGYVTQFANTPLGMVALVVIPASLLAISELYNLLVKPDTEE